MALHGRIQVNALTLGWWSARRLEDLSTPVDEHTYEWEASIHGVHAEGELIHRYSDGAAALAGKVLAAAAEQGVGAVTRDMR